jgi:Electron transfer DM13
MRRWTKVHPAGAAAIAILGLVLVGSGVYWFAPQRLFLDREVAESLPVPSASISASPGGEEAETPIGVEDLSAGEFRSLEHGTTGFVRIVELVDGSRFVRLQDLDTSDGPDLRVYLTDQPISDDWGVWDDGRYIDLGALKGNIGDSNYRIPDGVDPGAFRTVVIWCRRFTVAFGVAPI